MAPDQKKPDVPRSDAGIWPEASVMRWPSAFSRAFRREFGAPPATWRRDRLARHSAP